MRHFVVVLAAGGFVTLANGQSKKVPPRFEDFPVPSVYRGAVKPPAFGDRSRLEGTDLRCFGDLTDYVDAKVNFAGHFVIGTCTCGSGCHYLFMWDASTGKFYERLPPGVIDVGPYRGRDVPPPGIIYNGEQFQANSSLLIVEGCIEDTCDCGVRYYRWNGSRFELILKQPARMPERCLK